MDQRCVNCDITSNQQKSISSESDELRLLIQSWIAPQSLSDEDIICNECWDLVQKALKSKNHTRCYGHTKVCIGCGNSTLVGTRSRAYKLVEDGIPNAKYHQLISEWIAPKLVTELSIICYPCVKKAKRWVERERKKEPPKLSINNLCRVCLRRNDDMLCIFEENNKIQHKIQFCTGIQVINDSDKPTKICISCNSDLNAAFVFKSKFLKSNNRLSTVLNNRSNKRKLSVTAESKCEIKEKKIKKEFEVELKFSDVPVPFDYNDEALTIPIENTDGDVKHECDVEQTNMATDLNTTNDYSCNGDVENDDFDDLNQYLNDVEDVNGQQQTKSKATEQSSIKNLVLKTCKECTKEFTIFSEYKQHLQTHSKLRLKCEICDEVFPSYHSRLNHKQKMHKGAFIECDNCSYKTHNKKYMKKHIAHRHSSAKPKKAISCKICHEVFSSYKRRDEHFDEEHLHNSWLCQLCDKLIYEEKEAHMLLHSAPRFECHDCGHKSYTKENIETHIMKIHLGILEEPKKTRQRVSKRRPWPCEVCRTKFDSWHAMMTHMKEHNAGYWICPVCGIQGTGNMTTHMTLHSAPHLKCDYCHKQYRTKVELSKHMKRYHMQRNEGYQCEICSKYMVTKTGLHIHQRNVHLKEKNYQCPECGVWKFNKAQLKNHMFKHNGVKDLKCELCDSAYARVTYLKNHMQKDHGITVPNLQKYRNTLENTTDVIRRYLVSIGRLK